MRTAIKPIPVGVDSHTITAVEVQKWSANARKPWPNDVCAEVAAGLNKMQWFSDPPLPLLKDGERRERSIDFATSPPKIGEWQAVPDLDDDQWWDFQAAADAAKTLLNSVPAMLAHSDGLRWAPKTRDHYAAIEALRDALVRSMPYIEWPFGKYEPQDHRKKSRPSDWHMPAVVIAGIISRALVQFKVRSRAPSFSRDSIEAQVVHEALTRTGYKCIDTNTIAAHLTRRAAKFGKTT
ncbi:MAG TPA: hypothetical protein VIJ52_04590 [Pseudolabrys sp.]